ncbi:cytochrome d ubiquinol oxidase subunit II [Sulfurimonas sp.]|uniref:cytochrome d ubiquinol oxidase subunit II n=1 Tax=Sulfurimonas sp. TaxID=2022749 RepID=UPI0026336536|nr:cytochrome d ubiquinol oxidase subunit II [Sulfurimonas sp.]
MFDLLTLQEYWWFLVSVIGALFVFMTFVQGGQMLLYTLGKTEDERDLLVNSLGRKWELTFTALVMFGGALFAAFPLFYAVSFGGAYFVWMAILFCFIIQAVAYEYRKKPDNFYGERFYETLLYINGSLGIFLIGVALGTLFTGGNFTVNEYNLSQWTLPSYGLEALLNPFNVAFGLMLVFLARVQGALYFFNNLNEPTITARIKKVVTVNFVMFLVLFLYVLATILFSDGYVYDPNTGVVSIESMKFLHSFLAMPLLLVILLVGVLTLLFGIFIALIKNSTKAIWFSGLGTVLTVTILMLILGVNNSVYYPSLADLQSSLTIENSSGSFYTLSVMSVVSLLVPVVLGYIIYFWRKMDTTKITIDEIKSDPHHY